MNSPDIPSGAVDQDEDHATEGPCNAKDPDATALVLTDVNLALVPDDGEHSDVKEEEGGDELSYDSPVEGPLGTRPPPPRPWPWMNMSSAEDELERERESLLSLLGDERRNDVDS